MYIIKNTNVLEALKDLCETHLNSRITSDSLLVREYIDQALLICTQFDNCGFTVERYMVECKAILEKYKDLKYEFASNEVKDEIEKTFMNLILLSYVGSKYYRDNLANNSDRKYAVIIYRYICYLIRLFNYKIINADNYFLTDIEKISD